MSTGAPGSKPRANGQQQKAAPDRAVNGKESWKAAGRSGTGLPASAYNPVSGTFHSLDPKASAADPVGAAGNGRYRSFDEVEEGGPVVREFDSVSNNGSCSGESEDQQGVPGKDRGNGTAARAIDTPAAGQPSATDKRDKMRAKNEKKHQRQKERRAQELRDKCVGFLTARKLESLASQLIAMGFPKDRATVALICNDGQIERSVAWLLDSNESTMKDERMPSGLMKLDISEELARLAEMELRYGYARSEIERAIVTAEGDLDKAAGILRDRHPHGVTTPPDAPSPGSSPAASPGMSPSVHRSAAFSGRPVEMANGHASNPALLPGQPNAQSLQGANVHMRPNGSVQRNSGLSQALHDMRKEEPAQSGHTRWQLSQGALHPPGGVQRYGHMATDSGTSTRTGYMHQNGALDGMRGLPVAPDGRHPHPVAAPAGGLAHRLPQGAAQPYPNSSRFVQDPRASLLPAYGQRPTPAAGGQQPSLGRLHPPVVSTVSHMSLHQRAPVVPQQQPQSQTVHASTLGAIHNMPSLTAYQGWSNGAQPPQAGPVPSQTPAGLSDNFWKGGLSGPSQAPEYLPNGTTQVQDQGRQLPTLLPHSQPAASRPEMSTTAAAGQEATAPQTGGRALQIPPRSLSAPQQAQSSNIAQLPSSSGLLSGWGSTGGTTNFSSVDWSMGPTTSLQAVDWSVSGQSQSPMASIGLWNATSGLAGLSLGSGSQASAIGNVEGKSSDSAQSVSIGSTSMDRSYDLWNSSASWQVPSSVPVRSRSEAVSDAAAGGGTPIQEWTSPFAGKDLFPIHKHSVSSSFL